MPEKCYIAMRIHRLKSYYLERDLRDQWVGFISSFDRKLRLKKVKLQPLSAVFSTVLSPN